MGSLDDAMDNEASQFVDTNEFGEAVTHTTLGGTATSLNATVIRDETGIEAIIRNDSSAGVTAIERGDYLTVLERLGDSTGKDYRIIEIVHQDAAVWHVKLGIGVEAS